MHTQDSDNDTSPKVYFPIDSLIEGKSYAEWLYESISPFIKGRVLELGSGQGVLSSTFVTHDVALHLSDPDETNRDILRAKFKQPSIVKSVHKLDYHIVDFDRQYSKYIDVFDTVLALNVHEKGYYHELALGKAYLLLRNWGHLMILAPVGTTFFSGMEHKMEEYKKYNLPALRQMLSGKFEILRTRYLNDVYDLGDLPSKHLGLTVLAIVRKIN
jgi:hypothetical protein